MVRKPSRRIRYVALALEAAGVAAVLSAVGVLVNVWIALLVLGLVVIAAAQFLEVLL